jgi:hypothetical protein
MTTTLLAPVQTRVLDVLVEDAAPGRVAMSARVPDPAYGRDPLTRLLELATTATLRSVVGEQRVETLSAQVTGVRDLPAGTGVRVEGTLVTRGPRTVVVRALLSDEDGRPCGQSIVSVLR